MFPSSPVGGRRAIGERPYKALTARQGPGYAFGANP